MQKIAINSKGTSTVVSGNPAGVVFKQETYRKQCSKVHQTRAFAVGQQSRENLGFQQGGSTLKKAPATCYTKRC